MKFDDYKAIDRMNASTLVAGRKSMLHLKRRIDEGFGVPTAAMKFGSMVHCLVLEPDQFDRRYVVLPNFQDDPENVTASGTKPKSPRATKYYKEKVSEFARQHAGIAFVSGDDVERARKVSHAVTSKPSASMWVDDCAPEATLQGEIEGVQCKSRLDLYGSAIVDLKVTNTVSPKLFWQVFNRLGYGFKLAFYREIARQNCGEVLAVAIIAVESDGDFDCVVFEVSDQLLDDELRKVQSVMRQYATCKELDSWPGVDGGDDYMALHVPNWAMEEEAQLDWSA